MTLAGSGDGHDGEKFPGNSLFNDERRWPWMWGTGILAGGSLLLLFSIRGCTCKQGSTGHQYRQRSRRDSSRDGCYIDLARRSVVAQGQVTGPGRLGQGSRRPLGLFWTARGQQNERDGPRGRSRGYGL